MSFRVTKIICPHCEGDGIDPSSRHGFCAVCLGGGRILPPVARNYADNLYTRATGGYAYGDTDQKEKDRLTKRAMDVFRLLREMPPWLRTAA